MLWKRVFMVNKGYYKVTFMTSDILPDEIKTFYESLTENDIKTFDSFENSTMSNQQIYDEIKKKDSVLSQKIDTMAKAIGDKMNAMSDVPRDYLKSIVDELKNAKNTDPDQFSEEFAATLGKAEKLPQSAINEIVKAFPSLKVFFDEEKATTK
ncbi:hypothetical protein L596_023308 [Steinernema carpocapsae]|uniref:Uncharacterized protein n=1 Tax=Steinernema carpocapsae TaxID=34508 RepID=A0A4U5MD97_STECR|nr:hypothetical protein L596_023308 [Steinernema carpocapsae]